MYNALNQVIQDLEGETWVAEGKPSYSYILDSPIVSPTSSMEGIGKVLSGETVQKYFSKEDIKIMQIQVEGYKNRVYDESRIVNKKVISTKKLEQLAESDRKNFWDRYEELYGKTGHYNISFPIFSADANMMLISIETCEFRSSSSGGIYIFRRKDNKWVYWKTILGFLS